MQCVFFSTDPDADIETSDEVSDLINKILTTVPVVVRWDPGTGEGHFFCARADQVRVEHDIARRQGHAPAILLRGESIEVEPGEDGAPEKLPARGRLPRPRPEESDRTISITGVPAGFWLERPFKKMVGARHGNRIAHFSCLRQMDEATRTRTVLIVMNSEYAADMFMHERATIEATDPAGRTSVMTAARNGERYRGPRASSSVTEMHVVRVTPGDRNTSAAVAASLNLYRLSDIAHVSTNGRLCNSWLEGNALHFRTFSLDDAQCMADAIYSVVHLVIRNVIIEILGVKPE